MSRCLRYKTKYLSEASCRIAIRIEGKVGIVVPYPCGNHWHMTGQEGTVKRYQKKDPKWVKR